MSKQNAKDWIKNWIKGKGPYRKEQQVLAILLICFVVSGAALPVIGKTLQTTDGLPDTSISEGSSTSDTQEPSSDEDPSTIPEEDPADPDSATSSEASDSEEEAPQEDPTGTSDGQTGGTGTGSGSGSSKPSGGSQSSSSSGGNSSGGTGGSSGSGSSSSSGSGSSGSSTPSQEPDDSEKVWVPPVYETIHHEAVYETRRVYVCNFCSAEFNSVGEFQVHKDENGG
mgnify:CR=1 FL=1